MPSRSRLPLEDVDLLLDVDRDGLLGGSAEDRRDEKPKPRMKMSKVPLISDDPDHREVYGEEDPFGRRTHGARREQQVAVNCDHSGVISRSMYGDRMHDGAHERSRGRVEQVELAEPEPERELIDRPVGLRMEVAAKRRTTMGIQRNEDQTGRRRGASLETRNGVGMGRAEQDSDDSRVDCEEQERPPLHAKQEVIREKLGIRVEGERGRGKVKPPVLAQASKEDCKDRPNEEHNVEDDHRREQRDLGRRRPSARASHGARGHRDGGRHLLLNHFKPSNFGSPYQRVVACT